MSATLEKPKPGLAAALLIPFAIWLVASVVAVVFVVMGFQRANDVADDFARIDAGVDATVNLTEAGGYRIWLDRPGGTDEFDIVSATATITGPDGQDIPAEIYVNDLSYDDLEAVLTFNAPTSGEYTINAVETGVDPGSAAATQFAIGKDNPLGEIGIGFLLMFIIGGAGFLIALILLIVMLVKRGRSKKRITQASFQSGTYGGGYGGGGYGAPGAGYPPPGGYPPQQQGGYPPPGGSSW